MTKVALLIGVSEYEPGLNPLPAAVKDIAAMQRVLLDPEMGGFDQVKPLTNPDPQTMQYEIESLFSGRNKDDLVLLFFSGHGIKDDSGRLYFASRITCKNNRGDLIRSTAVPTSFVHDIMNNSRCRRQAIILDCCFSGAFDPALQAKDDGSVDLRSQLGAEGRVVLASSSSTEYSFEQQGAELSLYTRYLVEGIETGAGDRNADGFVSMLELHEYAASKVQETAPKMTPKIIVLKDKGFEIVLAKARVTDPRLKYRKAASCYANAGSIRPADRAYLNLLGQRLDLTSEEAAEIEAEVLRPYQERLANLQKYRETLIAEAEFKYPFSQGALESISRIQELLGLRDVDVAPIQQEVETQFFQKSAAYQQHLIQYEQAFTEAIQREFLFSQSTQQDLENLQRSLELRREDTTRIEKPLFQQAELRHQEKLKQVAEQQRQEQERVEYEKKLRRYEEEFSKAAQAEYPLSQAVLNELKSLQQQLELKDEDAVRIEQPIRQRAEIRKHNELGNRLKDEGKLDEAIAEYREALRIDPNNAGILNSLGLALHGQGNLNDAIDQFQKAVQLNPDEAGYRSNLETVLEDHREQGNQRQSREKKAKGTPLPQNRSEFDREIDLTLNSDEMNQGIQKRFHFEEDGKTITVKVPAGIKVGQKLRIKGKGDLDPVTQHRGNLYLRIASYPVQEESREKQAAVTIAIGGEGNSSVLGISLGISHTSVSMIRNGYACIATNHEGSLKIPTTIACKKDGSWIIGQTAKNQESINPLNTYEGIVRLLGQKYSELSYESISSLNYKVVNQNDEIKIECPALGSQLTPEEILAEGLRVLVDNLNKLRIQKFSQIVFSVPSCFTMPQRWAVERAACLAGLECLIIENSSTLAALAYGYGVESNETVLIADIDDGCIVTSILEIGDGVFETLSISGSCSLSGFESNQQMFDSFEAFAENALRDAKLNKDEIDKVILVRQNFRTQLLESVIQERFDKTIIQNPYSGMAVALGAALRAGVRVGLVKDVLILDVTPWSLGVETLGGVMTKIIPRNTTIPTKKSEVFSTAVDGQSNVEIAIFQGEKEMANDNISLGTFRLDGIPPALRGVPQIEVTFDIDANGLLNICAKDKGTGKEIAVNLLNR